MSRDTLSDVLRGVRLRGSVFFSISGHGDWAAEARPSQEIAPRLMPGVEHVIEYHAVVRGHAWAGLPGAPSVQLGPGDIVMFPHGDAHVLSSRPGLRGDGDVDWGSWMSGIPVPVPIGINGRRVTIPAPDGEADAKFICGFFGCDLQPFNPLIASLPRMLHLRASDDYAWLTGFTQQAATESQARRPGAEAMLARMSEMMFVDAMRRYADLLPQGDRGWLAGLRDRFVGRALALMHERPDHPWTIEELAGAIGLSRSALHDRFVLLLGSPPMQYLSRWRMQAAARLLLETRSTVAAIALEVGYDSEAAFARAFKRTVGRPPAAWRRERDQAAPPAAS